MISVPSETYGRCSHSTPYGSGISALSSPTVTQLSHHTNIGLESPCWDKFPPPVKIQRTRGGRLLFYTSDTQFTFSLHLWHNIWACSFSLRAKKKKKNSVESKTTLKDSYLDFWFDSAWYILKFNSSVFMNLSLKIAWILSKYFSKKKCFPEAFSLPEWLSNIINAILDFINSFSF